MYIYKIYFTIKISCKGIISYAKAYISIIANSEKEATEILGQNLDIQYNNTDKIKEQLAL